LIHLHPKFAFFHLNDRFFLDFIFIMQPLKDRLGVLTIDLGILRARLHDLKRCGIYCRLEGALIKLFVISFDKLDHILYVFLFKERSLLSLHLDILLLSQVGVNHFMYFAMPFTVLVPLLLFTV